LKYSMVWISKCR